MESINNMASAAAQAVWPNNSNNANATTETTNDTADFNNNRNTSNNNNSTGNYDSNYNRNYNNHSNIAANAATSSAKASTNTNTNAATTATPGSAIPNNNEEPISGVLGDTSKGEPYDAGNKDEQDAANLRHSESQTSAPGAGLAGATGATGTTGATGATGATGITGAAGVGGVAGAKSVGNTTATSANTTTDNTAANNDGSDNPAGTSAAAGDAGMKDSKIPSSAGGESKIDGPGPRPIQEVARDNHGDAGLAQGTGAKAGGGVGGNDDDDDKPQSSSHGEGTGEKYIRSSGLQADGGDFDAAREGAGREADRILEEKGISVGGGNQPGAADTADTAAAADGPVTSNNHGIGNSNVSGNSGTGTGTGTGNTAQGHKKKLSLGEKIKNKIRRSS